MGLPTILTITTLSNHLLHSRNWSHFEKTTRKQGSISKTLFFVLLAQNYSGDRKQVSQKANSFEVGVFLKSDKTSYSKEKRFSYSPLTCWRKYSEYMRCKSLRTMQESEP